MSVAEPATGRPIGATNFPPEIIAHAVWLCFRLHLSFRDVQDLLAERGVVVSHEAIPSGAPGSAPPSLQGCVGDEGEPATSGTWTRWH